MTVDSRTKSQMASTPFDSRQLPRKRRPGSLAQPVLVLVAVTVGASAFIAYVLWPRWPAPMDTANTPALPITVAGVPFNVPPAAIRVPVQRQPGEHERVDLAFLWPSLEPPDPATNSLAITLNAAPTGGKAIERLFVTIAAAGDTLPPAERVKTIYPRYATTDPVPGPEGLAVLAFADGTPYQGEDLIYDATTPENFLVRCSRNGVGPTPGTCLYNVRFDTADVMVRFPRDWLTDWQLVADKIERLIASMRPAGS
jgi:hypothetical protein